MSLFLASVVLGVVPMVIYALVVWRLDRWEKEPFPLLFAAFCWGAVPAVIFAVIAQVLFDLPLDEAQQASLLGQLYQSSVVAPVTEELFKAAGVLLIMIFYRREIDSVLDGLIYGSMVGFGFSAVENILYFSEEGDPVSLIVLFFLRAMLFGLLHALFTGLTGVGLALGHFSPRPIMRVVWPILGLSLAILTHGLHNYFATIGGEHVLFAVIGVSLGTLWLIVMFVVCLVHENRWIRFHLAEEVEHGVLHARQALDAASFRTRSSLSLLKHGWAGMRKRKKLLHAATELAYKKQKMLRRGASRELLEKIHRLREEVRGLSRLDPLMVSGELGAFRHLPPPLPPKRPVPPPVPLFARKVPPSIQGGRG